MRRILITGFGLTFGIWLLTGAYFSRRISEVQLHAATVSARYERAQELLSTVRSQMLLASVFVRDTLLDPDQSNIAASTRRLEAARAAADAALEQYVPVLDARAEGERIRRLRTEVSDFGGTMLDLLNVVARPDHPDPRLLVRTSLMPKRELVIGVSEEVQGLNRSAFLQQQAEFAAVNESTQRRLWAMLGVALAACVAIGLVATSYAGRLEDRLQRQRARDVQTASELQQLSVRLITAQEEERRSIARELHDEVGQVLTAIKMELAVAQRRIEVNGGPPHVLDDLGLPAAVEWYLKSFGERHGLRVDLLQEGMNERLTAEVEAAAYRIVQETLTNVAKHAKATRCRVYLQRPSTTVLITVEDDGVGFDSTVAPRAGQPRGLGLIGIRERVSDLRGSLRIESTSGKGTRITVELPARARPTLPEELHAAVPSA